MAVLTRWMSLAAVALFVCLAVTGTANASSVADDDAMFADVFGGDAPNACPVGSPTGPCCDWGDGPIYNTAECPGTTHYVWYYWTPCTQYQSGTYKYRQCNYPTMQWVCDRKPPCTKCVQNC